MFTYNTKGTCSRQIIFDVDEQNKIHNVKFIGGCGGNLQGIARLVEGKDIDEIGDTLKGIKCRNNTSCPDQLSQAIPHTGGAGAFLLLLFSEFRQ